MLQTHTTVESAKLHNGSLHVSIGYAKTMLTYPAQTSTLCYDHSFAERMMTWPWHVHWHVLDLTRQGTLASLYWHPCHGTLKMVWCLFCSGKKTGERLSLLEEALSSSSYRPDASRRSRPCLTRRQCTVFAAVRWDDVDGPWALVKGPSVGRPRKRCERGKGGNARLCQGIQNRTSI